MLGHTLCHLGIVFLLCPFVPALKRFTNSTLPTSAAVWVCDVEKYTILITYCSVCLATILSLALCAIFNIWREFRDQLEQLIQKASEEGSFYILYARLFKDILYFVTAVTLLCLSFFVMSGVGRFLFAQNADTTMRGIDTLTVVILSLTWCLYAVGCGSIRAIFAPIKEIRYQLAIFYEGTPERSCRQESLLSRYEIEILKILWEVGRPAGDKEITGIAEYRGNQENKKPKSLKGTSRILNQLVKKGYLRATKARYGKVWFYFPTLEREELAARLLNNVSFELLGRPLVRLLPRLLSTPRSGGSKLTPGEQEMLRNLLAALNEGAETDDYSVSD